MVAPRQTEPKRGAAVRGENPDTTESPFELPPGTVVANRYRIVRLLGRGGMGAVYEAFEDALERRVALKLLHPIHATDPQVTSRFVEEAKVANRVRHPALVEVTDRGLYEGRPFLVMEHLDGETLAARLARDGAFEPADAIELLGPVFAAVSVLHDHGVVHRDLKPDNIFLARVGGATVARVLDLGVARVLDANHRLTATGAALGTPVYMAPEQVKSSRDATPRADQYALGCVVYEMLSGRVPFEADDLHGILVAKVTSEPVPIRAHLPSLPDALAATVMRALSRDPARRFAHVSAFAAALRESVAGEAPEAPADDTRDPVRPSADTLPAPDPSPPGPTKRQPRSLGVVVSLLVGFAALVTWWAARSRPHAPTTATPSARPHTTAPAPATTAPEPAQRAVEGPAPPSPTTPSPRREAPLPRTRTPTHERLDIDRRNPLRGARP